MNVEKVRRADGEIELIPAAWRRVRIGGVLLRELARKTPGGIGRVPAVEAATEYVRKRFESDFDNWSPEERADMLLRTIRKSNEAAKRLSELDAHSEWAAPNRSKAVPTLKSPGRGVMAVILKEVHGLSTLRIGEELGIPAQANSHDKGENQAVRKAAEQGRDLLEGFFGVAEWDAMVQRMQAGRERWHGLDDQPKKQLYILVAEYRATDVEQEERAARADGFDGKLDEWMAAWERKDWPMVARLRRSDERFEAMYGTL